MAKADQADEQLEMPVRADQGLRSSDIPAIRPRADEVTAETQSQHEHREHHRRREIVFPNTLPKTRTQTTW